MKSSIQQPKFIADEMLGTLARKLRIYGFDTLYIKHVLDEMILEIGKIENRIILTKDKMFFQKILKENSDVIFLDSKSNEIENLVKIFISCNIDKISYSLFNSRCALCNMKTKLISKNDIYVKIPEKVKKSASIFYNCENCKKLYWEGSHIRNIQKYILEINNRLKGK
jgi:uncharacterized protein with PIN domain